MTSLNVWLHPARSCNQQSTNCMPRNKIIYTRLLWYIILQFMTLSQLEQNHTSEAYSDVLSWVLSSRSSDAENWKDQSRESF